MEDIKQTIDSFGDTSEITNTLMAIIYWLGVLAVILIVIYVIYAVSTHFKNKRFGINKDNDDFLDD